MIKLILIPIFVMLLIIPTALSIRTDTELFNLLISQYEFEINTTHDSSGRDAECTVFAGSGTPVINTTNGQVGQSMLLDGDSHITCGVEASNINVSISFWAYKKTNDGTGGDQVFVSQPLGGGVNEPPDYKFLWVDSASKQTSFTVGIGAGSHSIDSGNIDSLFITPNGTWTFFLWHYKSNWNCPIYIYSVK